MSKPNTIQALTITGYACLALAGVPQWWHMLATGDVAGVSPWFLGAYAFGLTCLQLAFWRGRLGRALAWGNALGLANILASLAAYLYLTKGGGA